MRRGTCLRLGLGELAAVAVFTVVAFASVMPRLVPQREVLAFWSVLAPLLVISVQAAAADRGRVPDYFVVRLAHPAHRWWALVRQRRTPQLIQDLRSANP